MDGGGARPPGTLADAVRRASARALASGALLPIPTEHEFIDDGGARFFVRVLTGLARKDEERKKRERRARSGRPENPFLPYDRELFVAEVSDTHVAILNKFNVVERHLLVVTRRFVDQRRLLDLRDFEALSWCMRGAPGIGFYNGGVEAGASQPHKHLQLVPLPLAPAGPTVPIAPLLPRDSRPGSILEAPGLGFLHGFARIGEAGSRAAPDPAAALELYRALLRHVGLDPGPSGKEGLQRGPYCLLVTAEWMLLVPRSAEFFGPVSINSLGYAGALLVRDAAQLRLLRETGPLAALRAVGLPVDKGSPTTAI